MATEEDIKTEKGFPPPHPSEDERERADELIAPKDGVVAVVHDSAAGRSRRPTRGAPPPSSGRSASSTQGTSPQRSAIAFLSSKFIELVWTRLQMWKPQYVGEPHGEMIMPIAGAIGVGVAWYYWREQRTRELAEEVASELSKVTWPSKDEVMSSTSS